MVVTSQVCKEIGQLLLLVLPTVSLLVRNFERGGSPKNKARRIPFFRYMVVNEGVQQQEYSSRGYVSRLIIPLRTSRMKPICGYMTMTVNTAERATLALTLLSRFDNERNDKRNELFRSESIIITTVLALWRRFLQRKSKGLTGIPLYFPQVSLQFRLRHEE
jgi:hypothetical protein